MRSAPSAADGSAGDPDDHADDIIYPSTIPFLLVHLACFAALWTGVTIEALLLGGALYVVRMFAVTAGYHRYFAHRTYQTSRLAQFLLAFLAQTSAQRGVLWWAANHRTHHRHADTLDDVHSPRQHGFWRAHVGWIFTPRRDQTDYAAIADFTRYPELVWLDRLPYLPPVLLALATWLVAGWPGLIVGFCWSTVLLWHATFAINSVAHLAGRQRYLTGDDSRNNWWLAILTLGEGWHNNHHAYQSSVRQGFRWWEYDPTFSALKALSWLGLVWNLHSPPAAVIRGEQRLGRKVIEKVAHQLAFAFPHDRIAALTREELDRTARWEELQVRLGQARSHAEAFLHELHLPHVPSVDEIRRYAEQHLARSPSLEEIVARARQILLESVAVRLLASAAPAV